MELKSILSQAQVDYTLHMVDIGRCIYIEGIMSVVHLESTAVTIIMQILAEKLHALK